MTDSAGLERQYRRLLGCYPRSFRRDNEDEILAVLMAAAEPGRTRVGLADCRGPAIMPAARCGTPA